MSGMRKYFYKLFLLVQIVLLFTNVGMVSAEGLLQESEQDTVYTFKELGYDERVLLGPYDSERLLFSLPPTWELNSDAKIVLRYKFTSNNLNNGALFQDGRVGGLLLVSFNDVVIDTVVLDQNVPVVKELSIPAEALQSASDDGRYMLSFFLDASFDCGNYSQSTLVITANSEADFQHDEVSPVIDLAQFPRAIYQPDPLVPINTVMVIPDQPSEMEVQAALSALSGIGSVTNGEMTIPLVTIGNLSQEIVSSSNLIFVGEAAKLPMLGDVELPLPLEGNKILVNSAVDDDGIIQMALSPWNAARVVYFVSGNTDVAILKAGQTLGTGHIVSSGQPGVSIIRSVNADFVRGVIAENQTFADLGYENEVMGIGKGQYLSYTFFASAEQAASTDGYLDLVVSQSPLIDFDKSGVSVFLNGDSIGTIGFGEQAEGQLTTTRLKFFAGLLQRGVNYIEVISQLVPRDICVFQNLSDSSSITIAESSLIYLPTTSSVTGLGNNLFLNSFPSMFLTQTDLSDLSFVLPSNDPVSWDYASRIAYYIGYIGGVSLPNLNVSFGENVQDEIRKSNNMIIVGRASSLPFVSELSEAMPAPFESGGDEAVQPSMMVNYRLLPGVNVGYLELFSSPWNSENAILAVMANSADGIPLAGNMLLKEDAIGKLGGNFSIVYENQILNTDTRLGVSAKGLVSQLPVAVAVTPVANTQDGTNAPAPLEIIGRPKWIIPALIVLVLAIIVVAAFALRRSSFNSSKKSNFEQDKKEQ